MRSVSVVDLVLASVRDCPQRIAVASREAELTYAELGRMAMGIGTLLRAHGASRTRPVAIHAEPSIAGIVAIVGVVLAGFAYVPVCPSLPRARKAAMLANAGVEYALVCDKTLPSLDSLGVVELAVDGMTEFGDDQHAADAPDPGDPVAVIFTSGSTGEPKGVLVPHRALANRVAWGQQEYPLSADDRILQHTRYIYDFSAWEVFASLAGGATLVTGPFRNYPDFGELAGIAEEFQVTVAHFVPSVLSGLVKHSGTHMFGSLRLLFSGGETLTRSLAKQVAEVSSAILYNQYGPTETCVDSTFHRYSATEPGPDLDVPIGRAIAETRTYLLDDRLDRVDASPGELYLGGVGVAHGYVGRAALTAARFLPDPWGGPGERMYRTGDLVRRLHDGGLMFVGRADRQVNIRGVRVELAEVESVMTAWPGVANAIATMTTTGRPNLVAVVEREPGSTVDGDEVRDFVRDRLPAAFVPDRVFVQDRLPRLPTGKTDQAAAARLAVELDQRREPRDAGPDEPADGLLAAVLAVWRRFFDVSHIPADADFFDIGGHSLLAVEVVSVVNDELDAAIDLPDFFELPTPRNMVALLEGARG